MKLWLILGAAAATVAAFGATYWLGYSAGRSAEQSAITERINEENENAGAEAEDWRARLRACVDSGGLYDFETSACDR